MIAMLNAPVLRGALDDEGRVRGGNGANGRRPYSRSMAKVPMMFQSVAHLNGYGLVAVRNGKLDDARNALDTIKKRLASSGQPQTEMQPGTANHICARNRRPTARSPKIRDDVENNSKPNCGSPRANRTRLFHSSRKPPPEEDALSFEFWPSYPHQARA